MRLTMVRPTVPALSEALEGGLPTEALTWRVDGSGYTFYLDRHRVAKALPGNQRAAVLAARWLRPRSHRNAPVVHRTRRRHAVARRGGEVSTGSRLSIEMI